jgi:HSP20 family protein
MQQPLEKDNHMARVDDPNTKQEPSKPAQGSEKRAAKTFGLGGLLSGFGDFIEKLGELADAGEELSRSGEFSNASGKIRGVYGINVKTGIGDQGQTELKVEPFGNVRPSTTEKPPGEDIREPLIDIHEEEDFILVLVELPGVSKENIELNVEGNQLDLVAPRGKTIYRKKIDLPEDCSTEQMQWDCHNGILKIRLTRKRC